MNKVLSILSTLGILLTFGCHSIDGIKNNQTNFLENLKKDLQGVNDFITKKPSERKKATEEPKRTITKDEYKVSTEPSVTKSTESTKTTEEVLVPKVDDSVNDEEEIVIIRAK